MGFCVDIFNLASEPSESFDPAAPVAPPDVT